MLIFLVLTVLPHVLSQSCVFPETWTSQPYWAAYRDGQDGGLQSVLYTFSLHGTISVSYQGTQENEAISCTASNYNPQDDFFYLTTVTGSGTRRCVQTTTTMEGAVLVRETVVTEDVNLLQCPGLTAAHLPARWYVPYPFQQSGGGGGMSVPGLRAGTYQATYSTVSEARQCAGHERSVVIVREYSLLMLTCYSGDNTHAHPLHGSVLTVLAVSAGGRLDSDDHGTVLLLADFNTQPNTPRFYCARYSGAATTAGDVVQLTIFAHNKHEAECITYTDLPYATILHLTFVSSEEPSFHISTSTSTTSTTAPPSTPKTVLATAPPVHTKLLTFPTTTNPFHARTTPAVVVASTPPRLPQTTTRPTRPSTTITVPSTVSTTLRSTSTTAGSTTTSIRQTSSTTRTNHASTQSTSTTAMSTTAASSSSQTAAVPTSLSTAARDDDPAAGEEPACGGCSNNGWCVRVGDGYRCVCAHGYHGDRCEKVMNKTDCASQPCQNKGACTQNVGDGYTCLCVEQYYGDHCQLQYQSTEDDVSGGPGEETIITVSLIVILAVIILAIVIVAVVLFRHRHRKQEDKVLALDSQQCSSESTESVLGSLSNSPIRTWYPDYNPTNTSGSTVVIVQ